MSPGSTRSKRKGFTLLEVLIALAFVGIALVAIIRTQGQGIVLAEEARFRSKAIFLCRLLLSEAQAEPDFEAGSMEEAFEYPLDNFKWEREIAPVVILPGLYRITVWVAPAARPTREGVSLQGFVYKPGGEEE